MTCLMSPFAECRSQPAAAVLWSPQAVCPGATVNTAAVRADDATTARNLRRVATTMPPRRPGIDLIEMLAVRETDQNICTLQVIPPPGTASTRAKFAVRTARLHVSFRSTV